MDRRRTGQIAAGLAGAAIVGAAVTFAVMPRSIAMAEAAAPYRLTGTAPFAAAPPAARWFDTEWGWIVVSRDADAALVAEDMRAAVAAFYRYFGKRPEHGAVVDLEFAALAPALKTAGATWLLPWPFRADGAPVTDGHHGDPRSALRHEIAHALFLALVIGNTRGAQYGGDAPDWLDEAAAMMAETPAATDLRRRQFAEAVTARRVPPFEELIAATHPLYGAPDVQLALAAANAAPGTPVVLKLSPADTGINPVAIADFYGSARAVADYLIERSGDERILARIADLVREEGNPTAWLDTLCAERVLPVARDQVDADFAAWAERQAAGS